MRALLSALVALVALVSAVTVSAQQSAPEMTLKESHPRTGSSIRRSVAFSHRLPFNRRYEELSNEQRALLHSYYESIGPGDEPPFPLDGLKPIVSIIQRAQAKLLVEGDLSLLVTVGGDGVAREVEAIGSPSPEMTKFAASVLMLTKFKPALCGGEPCSMQFPLYLRFGTT